MARQSPLSLDQVLEGDVRLARGALVAYPLGTIEVPTGKLVACDPLAGLSRAPAFTVAFAPGGYEASLRVIRPEVVPPQLVSFDVAQLVVASPCARCATWELALVPFEDTSGLRAGQLPGIRVETATAAIFDAGVQDRLGEAIDRVRAAKEQAPGGGVAAHAFAVASSAGDGSYPAFVGRTATGEPVALILDFRMIPIVTPPVLSSAQLDARVAAVTADLARASEPGAVVDDLGLSVDEVGELGDRGIPLLVAVERVLAGALAGTLKARGFISLETRAATVLGQFADRDSKLADRYLRFLTAGDTGGVRIALAVAREMAWTGREAEVSELIDRAAATAPEPEVVVAALRCLRELSGSEPAWERYAGHPAVDVQRALIDTLFGRVGMRVTSRDTGMRVVAPLLRADDGRVRGNAISFVAAHAEGPVNRRPLVELLDHGDAETALAAALALAGKLDLAPDERSPVRVVLERFAAGGDRMRASRASFGLATLTRNAGT